MELPVQYIVQVIYRTCKRPHYNRHSGVYNFECPVCGEGKSAGKKRRGFFMTKENYVYCQNCVRGWSAINWVMAVTGMQYSEILQEAREFDSTVDEIIERHKEPPKRSTHVLPHDSINLSDPVQLNFYKDNKVVQDCMAYLKRRRLLTAINRPKTFYVSLSDKIHRRRLVIPFYDRHGKIVFYQTRAIYKEDEDPSKYMAKLNADKTVFGVERIDPSLDYLFIFEGPIDSMFVKNGLAMGGIKVSDLQEEQLRTYNLYKRIWVLDNPFVDTEARDKIEDLVKREEAVFICPEKFRRYKDLNEMCVDLERDSVPPEFIIKSAYCGVRALVELKLN